MNSNLQQRRRGRPPKVVSAVAQTVVTDFAKTAEQFEREVLSRRIESTFAEEYFPQPSIPPIPSDWVKGQLLNVRHAGAGYRICLLGEEPDARWPDRYIEFASSFEAQQFVSQWYSREHSDPRAF